MPIDFSNYQYLGFYNSSPMFEGFCTPIFIFNNQFFEQDILDNQVIGMKLIELNGMFFQHTCHEPLNLGVNPIYAYFTGKKLIIGCKDNISTQLQEFINSQSYNLYEELKIDVLEFLGQYAEAEKLSSDIESKYTFKM